MGRKVRSGGSTGTFSFNKSKKYKYNSTGSLEEFTGEAGAEEITISGSKSSLRRMADMERNISILATKLTTTDGEADDGDNDSFGTNVNKTTRFKKGVRIDDTLDMKDTIDMNSKKITDLAAPTSGADAANKTYVDAAQAAAISTVTNGAGAAFDTLSEIQNAMATDAELSSAIASVTSAAASTAAADATTKADAAEAAAISASNAYADTKKSEAITISYAYTDTAEGDAIATASADATAKADAALAAAKVYADSGDADTTYTAGNGLSLSGTSFAMSGSYTGSFTATGDITAYSDDTLKTNVQVIDGALGKVEAIRGVTFDRISDGSTSTGVIAQELKAVLPEAVHTDAEGVHSVAYGNITGLLIEAVKELSAQVEELKAKK